MSEKDSVSLDQVWARRASLVWRRVGDEGVILDPQGKKLRGLNLTAWWVWEQLDGTRALADVAQSLAESYALSASQAIRDVVQFVAALRAAGLIKKVV